MPFVNTDELPRLELFPKALSAIVHGDQLMLSFLELAPGCEIPEHSHPHEQAGLVLSGSLRFRIGDEERVAGPGDAFIIPGNGDSSTRMADSSIGFGGRDDHGPAGPLDSFTRC